MRTGQEDAQRHVGGEGDLAGQREVGGEVEAAEPPELLLHAARQVAVLLAEARVAGPVRFIRHGKRTKVTNPAAFQPRAGSKLTNQWWRCL